MHTPRTTATDAETEAWRERRSVVGGAVRDLLAQDACWQCRDQATGESILGERFRVLDEPRVFAELVSDPRSPGHAVVVWRDHAADFTELDADETAVLFNACRRVARAIRSGLAGVERVYLVTMCDGDITHLHVQLIPRYAGSPIGSLRLVDPRGPVLDGSDVAAAIRDALD